MNAYLLFLVEGLSVFEHCFIPEADGVVKEAFSIKRPSAANAPFI